MLNKKFNYLLLAFWFMASYNLQSQDCTLSCSSNEVDIILDQNCERIIVLADVLSSSMDCNGPIVIELYNELSQPILSSPMINGDYIGQIVTATILDTESGNSCDVPLNILDKQIPQLSCGNLTYSCESNVSTVEIPAIFNSLVNQTVVADCQEFDLSLVGLESNIADINVFLDFNLSDVQGGTISLESPSGSKIILLSLADIPSCENNLEINIDDQAIQNISDLESLCQAGATEFGRYSGQEELSEFIGEDPNGLWTIEVCAIGAGVLNINEFQIELSSENVIFPLPINGSNEITQIDANTFTLGDFDGCGSAILSYFDIVENPNCDSDFNQEIIRTWNVIDQYGNENSCTETISFIRKSPDEISLPQTLSEANGNALNCEMQMPEANGVIPNIGWNALANGHPSPDDVYYDAPNNDVVKWYGTGRPVVGGCFDLNFTYTDVKINSCSEEENANCFKITRTWIANDPCTNTPFEHVQQIFVIDDIAPSISGVEDVTISTEGFSCQTDWAVPVPTFTDNCATDASLSYEVFTNVGFVTYSSFNNQYTVRDIPVGVHTITITASDCCGNESSEYISLEVRDQILPSVVCESYLTVNLAFDGTAKVFAQSFDEGSNDGCGPVFFKVIRMVDLQGTLEGTSIDQSAESCNLNNGDDDDFVTGNQIYFDDFVQLCCEDLDNNVEVVLRVFDVNPGTGTIHPDRMKIGGDLYNRFNDCMPQVIVNDKQAPSIVCPMDITINCNEWFQDTSLTGVPIAYDNCSLSSVDFEDDINLNQCQVGTIARTWTATDHTGRTTSCEQIITMEDNTDPIITYPTDRTIDCADLDDLAIAGQPIVDDNCALIGWNYSDQIFPIGGSCKLKVIRTWSGMDLCDWVAYNGQQTIIAEDNQAPILLNIPVNITVECDNIPLPANVEASDDCDNASTLTLAENIIDQTCAHTYILERIWTAVDVCGNEVSDGHLITIQDNVVPVFDSIPLDMNLSCAAQAPLLPLTATDNCDPNPVVSFSESTVPGDCPNRFTLVRTWTVSDICGNSTMISQNLNFSDDEDPILINVPDDLTISCGEDIPAPGAVSVTDNCDTDLIAVLTESDGPDFCEDGVILTRTWMATDACGNTTSAEQNIFLFDNDPPVFDELPGDITISCTEDLPDSKLTATDACTPDVIVDFNMGIQFLNCPQNQILTRTWTAEDDCGNETTHSMTITITDEIAPFIEETISDITINCEDQIPSSNVTVRDNCDGNPSVDFEEITTPGACANEFTIQRTWELEDACGNSETVIQFISIVDDEMPIFNAAPDDITVECNNIPDPLDVIANDNCDGTITPVFTELRTNGSCIDSYTLMRSWTATDGCGNTNSISQTIFVEDTTNPIISAGPTEIFASCDNIPNPANPVATDNCDISLTISFSQRQIESTCPDLYRLERTWTTFDNCGNEGTFVQNVIVSDDEVPTLIGVPADITVSCNEIPTAAIVSGVDNCDPEVMVQFNEVFVPGLCDVQGVLTRTWTVADRCGNVTTDSQVINVGNSLLPVFSGVPANTTVSCESVPPPASPTAEGACGTMTTITFVENMMESDCDNEFQLERIWTAVDDCGNESTATQIVNVTDLIDPVFANLPMDITISCSATIPFAEPTASDNCAIALEIDFSEDEEDGQCEGEFFIIRSWMVEDNCGNTAEHTQVITIQDNDAPEFEEVPEDITVSCEEADMDFGSPDIIDVCDEDASFELLEIRNNTCPGTYTIQRIWTGVDDCGNTVTAEQLVTVIDDVAPELNMSPVDMTVSCEAIPAALVLTAEDDCDSNPVVQFVESRIDGDCDGNYMLVRTWTATDNCGNVAEEIQNLLVTDLIDPTFINFPANFEVSCANDPLIDNVIVLANDNCDSDVDVTINESIEDSLCINQFEIVREYVITDHCGNSAARTLTITVNDNVPPEFPMLQADISVSCEDIPDPSLVFATDNCFGPIDLDFTENISDSSCIGRFTLMRKWVASDACGNTDSVMQTIQVFDDTPPVFIPEALPNFEISCEESIPPVPTVTAIDNCGVTDTIDFFSDIVEEDDLCPAFTYKIRRTWIVLDACSNSAELVQVISVADNSAPTFVSDIPDVTVSCDAIPTTDGIEFMDDCDPNPTISFVDDRIDGTCGNEFVLNRTYTITDVCGNSNDELQTITIFDNVAPTVICPNDITVAIDNTIDPPGGDVVCVIQVDIPYPEITDNCDGTPIVTNDFINSIDGNASGEYPIGTTTVTFTVSDSCGNSTTCSLDVTVLDQVAPSIECNGVSQIAINPLAENSAFLFMEAFMPVVNDCQNVNRFFFPDTTDFLVFDCNDVGETIRIDAFAIDESGNGTGCFNFVVVIDPEGVCPTPPDGITGVIATEDLKPVGATEIIVNNQPITTTNELGNYLIEEVMIGSDYTIEPKLNNIDRQEITTLDLIRLGRHMIGLEPLDSPYKLIAADVDYSGSIDVFDLIELQKLVIHNIEEFSNGDAWRFIDQQYEFLDENYPLDESFKEYIKINNYQGAISLQNFVGVQLGNLNAQKEEEIVSVKKSIWNWKIPSVKMTKENEFVLPVFGDYLPTCDGLQLEWSFDTEKIGIIDLVPGQFDPVYHAKGNKLLLSAISSSPATIASSQPLFTMIVKAKKNCNTNEMFTKSNDFLTTYTVSNNSISHDIQLNVEHLKESGVQQDKDLPVLFSNRPNPFRDQTTLRFNLPTDENLTIQIVNVAGQALYRQSLFLKAGYQEIVLKRDQLNAEGVLFCQLITTKGTVTQKLLLLNQ